jgi:hypothetical protein
VNIKPTTRAADLRERLEAFMGEHVYPAVTRDERRSSR